MPQGRFATTRWTIVLAAGRESAPGAYVALTELCERYWPPLYGYARRQGYTVEQAEDLTQAFFARLIEKHYVQTADPQRGRFRSFLLASFKHFLSNERDRERARKRGGGRPVVDLDVEAAEARHAADTSHALTPEAIFERQWAAGILDRVLATPRTECVTAGKEAVFEHLKGSLSGEREPGGYADLARTLGTTEGAIKVTVHRLRRRYRDLLRREIGATVSTDAEIDDEIRHLIAVLSA